MWVELDGGQVHVENQSHSCWWRLGTESEPEAVIGQAFHQPAADWSLPSPGGRTAGEERSAAAVAAALEGRKRSGLAGSCWASLPLQQAALQAEGAGPRESQWQLGPLGWQQLGLEEVEERGAEGLEVDVAVDGDCHRSKWCGWLWLAERARPQIPHALTPPPCWWAPSLFAALLLWEVTKEDAQRSELWKIMHNTTQVKHKMWEETNRSWLSI